MDTTPIVKDKPWRPADHPRPGPSWDEPEPDEPRLEHVRIPDAED